MEKDKVSLNHNDLICKTADSRKLLDDKPCDKEAGLLPDKYDKKIMYESSCILARKSKILNCEEKIISKSQITKTCDMLSRVHSNPKRILEESAGDPGLKSNSEFPVSTGQKHSFGIMNANLVLEMMLYANIILYGFIAISTNHFTKIAFSNVKLPVAVDPVSVKIFYTLLLGFLADFVSPIMALLIPQVTCLATGFLLSLQVFPQHLAYVASHLPQLNSGLIGTQLLIKFSKPPESFAVGLSRINCIYCLTDLFSPWLLKIATQNIGFTFSYQVMTFSSFLVLVGVLYLFHTNHRKDACRQYEMNVFKSFLSKLFLSIPVALLLPRFQYLLRKFGDHNAIGLATAAALIVQQIMVVPLLQSFSNYQKIICISAALLAAISLSLVVMGTNVGFLLLVVIYGICGVAQNFVASSFVNSYPGMSGFLLAINLILYFGIRYLIAQFTGGISSSCCTEDCSKKIMKNNIVFKNLLSWFIQNEVIDSENIFMIVVYIMSSVSSTVLFVITKYL
ncbi:uncharacterized protein [Palaemon carinicauda]